MQQYEETRSSARDPTGILKTYGMVHFASLQDCIGRTVNFLWLVVHLYVSHSERGKSHKVWNECRVILQLSWHTEGSEEETGDAQKLEGWKALKYELSHLSNESYEYSNPVIFWRQGRLASGLPMPAFVQELTESIADMDKVEV